MRFLYITLLSLVPFLGISQVDTCNVCNTATLSSTYNPAYTHTWVCSDGQATTEVNPVLTVTEDMLCVLTVTYLGCSVSDSIYLDNCECEMTAELEYRDDSLFVLISSPCDTAAEITWEKYNTTFSIWEYVSVPSQDFIPISSYGLYRVTVDCYNQGCIIQDTYEVDACSDGYNITNFSNSFTPGGTPYGGDFLIYAIDGCATTPYSTAILQKFLGGIWVALDTINNTTGSYWSGYGGGTYRVIASGCGCTDTETFTLSLPCSVTVNITNSGPILTATYTSTECPSPTITWSWFNGTAYVPVGSGNTYNTSGIDGTYRAVVDCGGGCSNVATFTYSSCPINITAVVYNSNAAPYGIIVATSGCNPPTIKTYQIYQESFVGSGIWTLLTTTTNVANSVQMNVGSYGSFRIDVTGCGCTRSYYYNNIVNCDTYTVGITGWGNPCLNTSELYTATWSGGGGTTSILWYYDGVSTGVTSTTYSHLFTSVGTHYIKAVFTTSAGCNKEFTRTIIVVDCAPPPPPCTIAVNIAPNISSLCTGVSQTFTVSQTGGTTPITYTWTYTIGAGAPISAGTGTSKIINFTTAGVYAITVTAQDAAGCITTDVQTVTIANCTVCDCVPSITLVGCDLIIASVGVGCPGYAYWLEYSNNAGVSWTTIISGPEIVTTILHTPSANGLYRLRLVKAGCPTVITTPINVTCVVIPCFNPPTLTLGTYSGLSCELSNIVVNGNSIGGSATSATLSHNGAGALNVTWTSGTTFNFTYVPNIADVGTTVTILVSTNNPLGFPCTPATFSFPAVIGVSVTPTITSSNSAMCVNSLRTLTATPIGGTWTLISGPGFLTGNVLTALGPGNIVVGYTIGSTGCFTGESQTIPAITCVPTVAIVGCTVSVTFSGACTGYAYRLQYSATGSSPWSELTTGAPVNFVHNPVKNGYYRVLTTKAGCGTLESNVVNITCIPCGTPTVSQVSGWTFSMITPPANPNYATHCGALTTDWVAGMAQSHLGVQAGIQCIPPSFTTATFSSSIPVSWSYIPQFSTNNCVILSTTSTTVTIRLQWNDPGITQPFFCGGAGINTLTRFRGWLVATDACGNVVYRLFLLGNTVG